VDAEIEYGAVTDDGRLRAAVFTGLRDDLATPERPPKQGAHAPPRAKRSHHGVPHENILQLLPQAVAPSKDQ
jgi:bifunctional non-homologous end joining protein LigD